MRRLRRFAALVLLLSAGLFPVRGGAEVLNDPTTGRPVRYAGKFSSARVTLPDHYRAKSREFRGVWVATVENIDFPRHADAASFQRDFIQLVENLRKANFNAIFFQVRPMCDAFYPSKLNPWSRWMTGQEGRSYGSFDPLAFMVEEAHRRNLEFHAWMNPYRVHGGTPLRRNAYLRTLAGGSFARRNPALVLESKLANGRYSLFLNPGEPQVVRHIVDSVKEILARYPVDAIHFDDYFYLYTDIGNIDQETFRSRNPRRLSLAQWRRSNVDNVIYGVRQAVDASNRATGRRVAFGVSPFGIWANKSHLASGSLTGGKESYFAQYADSRGWVKKQWVDYIVPQIYWPFSHDVAAYAALTDWWSSVVAGTGVNLYIGHGVYRLGSGRSWPARELADQLRYNSTRPEVSGSVLFSYRSVFLPANATMKEGVNRALRTYWRAPALRPLYRNLQ